MNGNDVRPGTRQFERDGSADPHVAAGNDRPLAVKAKATVPVAHRLNALEFVHGEAAVGHDLLPGDVCGGR